MTTTTVSVNDDTVVIPQHLFEDVEHAARWRVVAAADELDKAPLSGEEFEDALSKVRVAIAQLDAIRRQAPLDNEEAWRLAHEASTDLVDLARDDMPHGINPLEISTDAIAARLERAQALRDFADQHAPTPEETN